MEKARKKTREKQIIDILAQLYPNPRSALNFRTPYELLVATMLSAQCTDKRVNEITAKLFPRANTPEQMIELGIEGIEEYIRGLGLFRNKSKNIYRTSQILLEKFNGEVPRTREELMQLPGVGRKTANVVLANAFQIPALAVDTHVHRVSNRLGLVAAKKVEETEAQLMDLIPKAEWIDVHHQLIYHGRNLCTARRPRCDECPLLPYCPTGAVLQ